jgi:cellulose synthase/poly-beta-1,6-N-acetylglucosamine synthase-like glycosyltransferase
MPGRASTDGAGDPVIDRATSTVVSTTHRHSNFKEANDTPQTIGVLIATYQRSEELLRCLGALERQTVPADDVIVVAREDDLDTKSSLADHEFKTLPVRVITVALPGTVAARNAGLNACWTDVLAIIDDDTSPHADWLSRVMQNFREDRSLGGLGGRDRCFDGHAFDDRSEHVVGKIQWFGRTIGNHHLGVGETREVDVLKGANMSYRAAAFAEVRFDIRLKGKGAQPSEDYCFSVAVKAKGWKLAYDPRAIVDHYASQRAESRLYVGVAAVQDDAEFREFAYNQVVSIWAAMTPLRRCAFFVWSSLIGTGVFPGLVQAVRYTPKLGPHSWRRFATAQQGKIDAFRDLLF